MNRRNRVLVLLGNRSLQEAVRAIPLCHAVKTNWPGTHLRVGCFRETQRVVLQLCLEKAQLVKFANLKAKKPRHCWRTIKSFPSVLRSMFGHEAIVLLHVSDWHWPMSLLARLTTARVFDKRIVRECSEPPTGLLHQEIAKQLFEGEGHRQDILGYLPRLHVSEDQRSYAKSFFIRNGLVDSRTIFMNPYRASKIGGWGLRKYINLANAISGCGVKVLMHEKGGADEKLGKGGIRDKEEFEGLRPQLERAGVVSAGNTSMRELIALIDRCDVTAGEPSGPVWIAATLGKATVTITPETSSSLASFLPSVSYGCRVSDARHTVLVHDNCQQVTESAAASILLERLGRCRSNNSCPPDVLRLSEETVQVLGEQEVCY